MKVLLKRFMKDEHGTELAEYVYLAALMIIACIVVVGMLGTKIAAIFTDLVTQLSG